MKFLWTAEYSETGAAGAIKDGGTGRKAAIEGLVGSVGGSLEACYFSGDDAGVVLIVDLPDQAAATAALFTIQASGAIGPTPVVTTLLTPAELDAAMKLSPAYTPPGA
ncbi:MAG: hypothetical protein ACI9N0_000618 [Ilumatobacter sp.]|jgi:uncharacterized protein with GYD domain